MKSYFEKAGRRLGSVATLAIALITANAPAQTNVPPLLSVPDYKPGHNYMGFDNHRVELVIVENAEQIECKQTGEKGRALLSAGKYDELDKLANDLRTSKSARANGTWKLFNFYCGLEPDGNRGDVGFEPTLAKLRAWVAARPQSITARVALANTLISYAWQARGSGWASTVTDEGWRLFGERIQQAIKVLDGARMLKAKCPVYWSVRLLASMAASEDRSDYDAMFETAVRSQPDYEGFYYRRAIYLLPRWGGAPGELAEDLAKSANKVGGPAGDRLYAQIVWAVHEYGGSRDVLKENNLLWPRVDRGFQNIEKLYPASLAALSEHARLAVVARDREQAHNCFVVLNGRVDLSVWSSEQQFTEYAIWSCGGKLAHVSGGVVTEVEPDEFLREHVPSRPTAAAKPTSPSSATKPTAPTAPTAASKPALPTAAIKPEPQPDLALKMISGPAGRRVVMINSQTFMVGESSKVRVHDTKIAVVCKEIRDNSVVITADGKPMELVLGKKAPVAPSALASRPPAPVVVQQHLYSYPGLLLKEITELKYGRIARINNLSIVVGEMRAFKAGSASVEVVCKEIRKDSVLITVDGKLVELKLPAKLPPQGSDKIAQN